MATGKRLVTLYVGKDRNGKAYREYTDNDLKNFYNKQVRGFVVVSGLYEGYLNNSTDLNTLLNQVATMVTRLTKVTPGCEIWISTPAIPKRIKAMSKTVYEGYATQLKNCLSSLKLKIIGWLGNENAFDTHITGVYMNHEHIAGPGDDFGQKLNYTSLSTMLDHPEVNMYYIVSNYVHGLGKKMLWMPFYGYDGYNLLDTIVYLGYIANRTNIFDYVLIQPHYYFNKANNTKANLAAIRASMLQNRVTYRAESNGTFTPVCSKTSNTVIGCQMEVDGSIINGRGNLTDQDAASSEELTARFQDCINCFSDKSGGFNPSSEHFGFYCGAKSDALFQIQGKIDEFYTSVN